MRIRTTVRGARGFAVLASMVACHGAAAPHPAPAPVAVPLLTTAAISAEETDEGGNLHTLGAGPRGYVDVNSVIRITPHLADMSPRGDTAAVVGLRRQVDAVSTLLASVRDSLSVVNDKLVAAASDFAAKRASHASNVATSSALLQAAEVSKVNLLRSLRSAAKDADARQYATVMNAGGPDRDRNLTLLVTARVAVLLDSAKREAVRLAARDQYRVELSAMRYSPGRTPMQIHLPGYDNLAAGDPNVIDKLSFARTADEQAQLDKTTTAIQGLIANSQDLGGMLRNLSSGATDAAKQIVGTLDSLKGLMVRVPPSTDLLALRDSVVAIVGNAALTDPLKVALTDLGPAVTSLAALRDAVVEAPTKLRERPTLMAPFDVLDAWSQVAKTAAAHIDTVADHLDSSTQRLPALAANLVTTYSALATTLTPEQRSRLQSVAGGVDTRIVNLLNAAVAEVGVLKTQLTDLRQRAEVLTALLPTRSIIADGAATVRSLIDVRTADAGPTDIDLVRADRRDGDNVVITLKVIDPAANAAVGMPAEYTLGVRNYGWYRRWTGGLAFAKTIGTDVLPEGQTVAKPGLRPGVSASWLVHFRRRPDQTDGISGLASAAFGAKATGVGLTSVLFTRDQSLELGFGPTVTFFGDLLQLGGGFNLQTEKWYFLLNTPLLELFQRGQANPPQ